MDGTAYDLRALLALVPEGECPGLAAECAGLAQRVREQRVRTLGLVPADDDVAIPRVLVHLGRALADRCDGPVGIVDAQGSWRGAGTSHSAPAADADQIAIRSEIADNLVFLAPRMTLSASALRQLQYVLARESSRFERLVVDLTGFSDLGEIRAASALLQGVLLVARRGRTTTPRLRRWFVDLRDARCLGVLLTGV